MRTPTPEELALQAEVRRLRERIAALENRRQPAETQVEQGRQGEFLATILANAPYGISVHKGHDPRYELVNPAYQAMVGTEIKLIGRIYREVFPEAAAAGAESRLLHVIDTGEPWIIDRFRAPIPGKPNAIWSGQVVRLPAAAGDEPRILAIVRDVTEEAAVEEALKESKERFRSLADNAPVIIFQNDLAGKATFFNRQATEFTGRTQRELVDYGWFETIHPADRDRVMATHRASLELPMMGQSELRLRRKDGQYRWMLVTAYPRFAGEQFIGYIGTIVDITDLKRAQGELLEAQKLESLGVLAGGIAHDFNNMLGSILANAELASSEMGADSPARECIERIQCTALRGSEIVRQLLAFAGQETTEFQSVDVVGLIREMLQFLTLSVSKHARIELDFPSDLPAVRANAAQISQVIMNLVINASEAIGERDGVIHVRATRVTIGPPSDEGDVPNLPEGEYVRIEVRDTGCGIPEEIRNRIFDPFFSTKFAGRGLGLAVVQRIVRRHGGAIEVASSVGKGTVFAVFLPSASQIEEGAHAVWKPLGP